MLVEVCKQQNRSTTAIEEIKQAVVSKLLNVYYSSYIYGWL